MRFLLSKQRFNSALTYLFIYVSLAYWIKDYYGIILIRTLQVIILCLFCYFNSARLNKNELILAIGCSVPIFLTSTIVSSYIPIDLSIVSSFFVAVCIIDIFGIDYYFEKYIKFLSFISIYSVCTFFLYKFHPYFFSFFPDVQATSIAKNTFFSVIPVGMDNYFRNFGCFNEPGMFQVYINIALIWILNKGYINVKLLISYIVAILTTLSTTGFVVTGILLISVCFRKLYNKHIKRCILISFIIFLSLICNLYLEGFLEDYMYVFTKLDPTEIFKENSTSNVRYYSLYLPLKELMDNVLLGCGSGRWVDIFKSGINFTCTQINVFALYGLFFGLIFNTAIIKYIVSISSSKMLTIVHLIAIQFLMFSQNLIFEDIIYIFIMLGMRDLLVKNVRL